MKKRIIAFVLSLCMFMSLCSSVIACGYEDASLSTSQLFNDATAQEILTAYAKEIQLIESEYQCSITGFTSDNIEMIKRIAALYHENEAYDFPGMMTDIALACARAEAAENDASAANLLSATGGDVSVCASSSLLAGMHLRDVAVGSSTAVTYSATFSVEAGSQVLGVTINRGYSSDFTYSVSGPADNMYLNNGARVTHRTAFALLYGTIIESGGRKYIEATTATIIDYTILASIAIPTYCGQVRGNGTFYFGTPYDYHQKFSTYPATFL